MSEHRGRIRAAFRDGHDVFVKARIMSFEEDDGQMTITVSVAGKVVHLPWYDVIAPTPQGGGNG